MYSYLETFLNIIGTKMNKVLVLFDFIDGNPGIGTVSSIKRPSVGGSIVRQFNTLTSFVNDKTSLIVRYKVIFI